MFNNQDVEIMFEKLRDFEPRMSAMERTWMNDAANRYVEMVKQAQAAQQAAQEAQAQSQATPPPPPGESGSEAPPVGATGSAPEPVGIASSPNGASRPHKP